MTNTAELQVLILNIEDMREKAKTSEHDVIDNILIEVRKTHDIITRNDFKVLTAIKQLSETYMTIQAY